jgi:phage FluMu protein Com
MSRTPFRLARCPYCGKVQLLNRIEGFCVHKCKRCWKQSNEEKVLNEFRTKRWRKNGKI